MCVTHYSFFMFKECILNHESISFACLAMMSIEHFLNVLFIINVLEMHGKGNIDDFSHAL